MIPQGLSLCEFLALKMVIQEVEIFSPGFINRARTALGPNFTKNDLANFYVECGEAERFARERFPEIISPKNQWYAGEEFHCDPTPTQLAVHYLKVHGLFGFKPGSQGKLFLPASLARN